ncbi:MAG: hypothetical protein JW829_15350 [Pirellulales bacterium]|nr:hypothetical protein [Pirellulales bacterium]
MESKIASVLTEEEKRVLSLYQSGDRKGLRRAWRLSIQYAIAGSIFTWLAIATNPLYSLVVYGLFLTVLAIRLVGASRIAGIMPRVIEKYERLLAEEKKAANPEGSKPLAGG